MKYPDTETLIQKFQRTSYIIHRQTEGITNEESTIQPPVRGNCMNWILGHILTERNIVLKLLGYEPVFTQAETERYQRESEPVTGSADGLPFDQLIGKLEITQRHIEEGLEKITPEELEKMAEIGTSTALVGSIISYIHWHETYHTGQFELLRQLAGKNDKVI